MALLLVTGGAGLSDSAMSCPVAMPGILSSIWTSLRILEISGI